MGAAFFCARPRIDPANGNLELPGRGGAVLQVQFQDDEGVFQDIAGWSLFFEIAGVKRIPLVAGQDATSQLVIIADTVIDAMTPNTATAFVLRDETGSPPVVRWEGLLRVSGFTAQPPN